MSCYPRTYRRARLLGPCFKTGRKKPMSQLATLVWIPNSPETHPQMCPASWKVRSSGVPRSLRSPDFGGSKADEARSGRRCLGRQSDREEDLSVPWHLTSWACFSPNKPFGTTLLIRKPVKNWWRISRLHMNSWPMAGHHMCPVCQMESTGANRKPWVQSTGCGEKRCAY